MELWTSVARSSEQLPAAGQRFELARREAHAQRRLVAPGHDSVGGAPLGHALVTITALPCCQSCIP